MNVTDIPRKEIPLQTSSLSETAPAATHAKARLQFVDIAKGIAILAVIVGHAAIRMAGLSYGASAIVATCFTFHMPLFFLLSGYFLHCRDHFSWRKESHRLVIPYVLTALAIVVLEILTACMFNDLPAGMSLKRFAFEWINAAIYASAAVTGKELWPQMFRIGAIWFLLALFWARLLVTAAYKTRISGILIVLCALVGGISARYAYLPFSIQAGMTASVYVYLGTLARKYDLLNALRQRKWVLAPALLIWIYAILHYRGFGMGTADFGQTPADIARNLIGSFGGMTAILIISMFIEDLVPLMSSHLADIGRISLLILAVHIIDDDASRIDAISMFLLGAGLGAFKLVILEAAARVAYTLLISFLLSRLRIIRKFFC